jgi:hypothetical protein
MAELTDREVHKAIVVFVTATQHWRTDPDAVNVAVNYLEELVNPMDAPDALRSMGEIIGTMSLIINCIREYSPQAAEAVDFYMKNYGILGATE